MEVKRKPVPNRTQTMNFKPGKLRSRFNRVIRKLMYCTDQEKLLIIVIPMKTLLFINRLAEAFLLLLILFTFQIGQLKTRLEISQRYLQQTGFFEEN